MKTILLLGGRSKRFWPLQDKPLVELCGNTVLEHVLGRLRNAGLEELIIVTGPETEQTIQSLAPDATVLVQHDREGGMCAALLESLPQCGTDSVLVVGGSDIVEADAYRLTVDGLRDGVDGVLLARKVDRYFPGGYLTLDDDRITGIAEKPGEGNEPSDLVNLVVHAHRDASVLLDALKNAKSDADDVYEVALASLFASHTYHAATYEQSWHPLKYPWHLLPLLEHILGGIDGQQIHNSVSIHPSAVVEGNVILEEGVRVLPHATVVGPCTIGKNSIIGNNALVRGSSIGSNSVIGYNTEVKGSVIGHHVWMHSTYVGDSVIGRNVSFGAGSVTGNLRLDEGEIASTVKEESVPTGLTKFGSIIGPNTRIGIHGGSQPGVKIGSNCFVAGGHIVSRDVPDGQFVVMKNGEVVMKPNKVQTPDPEERERYRKGL